MKENIKIAGVIALKSMVKWVLIVLFGFLVTLITFLVAFFRNIDLAAIEGQRFSSFFYGLLDENIPALILIFGAPIFVIIYIIFANKTSVQNAIFLLIKGKAGDYVLSVIVSAVEKITEKKGWHSELVDKAMLKARVLQATKDDPQTSRTQRSVIRYGFKKVNLEDVDFQDKKIQLSSILSDKFRDVFAQMMKPSLRIFWILIFLQIGLLIYSIVLR